MLVVDVPGLLKFEFVTTVFRNRCRLCTLNPVSLQRIIIANIIENDF